MINVQLGTAEAAAVMQHAGVQAAVCAVRSKMGDQGRVLLRPSGTEPLIRVMVEGREQEHVRAGARKIADAVASVT